MSENLPSGLDNIDRNPSARENDIDQRLKRLREEVLPLCPFLLTVPTEAPFRLGGRFVNNWAVSNDGPFTPDEQQLQYMTFLTHHEGDSLLVAVGDWSERSVMSDQRAEPQSITSTPQNGSTRKKISLIDYKNKQKTGVSDPPMPIDKSQGNSKQQSPRAPEDRKRLHEAGHELFEKKPRLSLEPNKSDHAKLNGLPTLLSPTLPPTSNSPRLPRLLSPTLPPDIEQELSRLEEPFALDPKKQKVKSLGQSPSSHSQLTDSRSEKRLAIGVNRNVDSPYRTHVVKLKYGRANRKRVEALLKFSGKKKMALLSEPSNCDDISNSRHTSKNSALDTRAKSSISASNSRDKPKQHPTSLLQDHAPVGRKTNAQATISPPSPSQSSLRTGERRAWKDEYAKYGNLGRELKHAAERYTAKDKASDIDEKLAAATAVEAILCFMLAFVADDQSKVLSRQVGDSSAWLSILAYWRVVKKNSTPYPRLHSLCLLLGSMSYNTIHGLDLERLATTPFPWETVGTTDCDKSRKDFMELKSRLPEYYKEYQRLWLEGSRGLSEDILRQNFPKTWSKRSTNHSEQGKYRLKAGNFSGEFFLPIGRISTPVEMVRFGYSMLKEWCSKEDLEWTGRLEI